MICFCDREVYTVKYGDLQRGDLFSFFCSKEHTTDIVLVVDDRERFVGIITYERLLYCKDNLIQSSVLTVGDSIWKDAEKIFCENMYTVYIPVFNQENELIYFCYQADMIGEIHTKTIINDLYECDELLFINELYPKVQAVFIYDLNELSFQFFQLLLKRNIQVVTMGEKWKLILGIETHYIECPSYSKMWIYSEGTPLVLHNKDYMDKTRFSLPNMWEFLYEIGRVNHIKTQNSIKEAYKRDGKRVFICSIPEYEGLLNHSIDEEYRHYIGLHINNKSLNYNDANIQKQIYKLYHMSYEELMEKTELLDPTWDPWGEFGANKGIKKHGVEENILYVIGPCIVGGHGNFYNETFLFYIYEKMKALKIQYSVKGISLLETSSGNFRDIIDSLSIKDRDIVIFVEQDGVELCNKFKIHDEVDLNFTELFNSRGEDEAWFSETPIHTMKVANKALANELVERIVLPELSKTDFSKPALCLQRGRALLTEGEKRELKVYTDSLQKFKISASDHTVAGSIVMNCNPVTLGHLYLIEYASSQVDYLYIFLVEEDRSFFKFEERIKLVQKTTAHLTNVMVIPSGQFIISNKTLPSYFVKDYKKDSIIDASEDICVFAEYIAPALDIKVRFVGEEPLDFVTNQYNTEMRRTLVDYDIRFVEIPRRELSGEVISASRVRQLLRDGNFEEIHRIVPEATYQFLKHGFDLKRCI